MNIRLEYEVEVVNIKRSSNEKMLDVLLYGILISAFSLQNKTILNFTVIKIGGIWLNFFDAIIIFCIVTLFFRFAYIQRRGFTKVDWILIGLFLFFFLMGVARQNELGNIFYNARAFFYLITMYWITKNFRGNATFFYKVLGLCSFLCSSIYFYTFFTNSRIIDGEFTRFVTFNFQIVLLYMSFSIYLLKSSNLSVSNTINIFYGALAIFTTQTRTLMIPAAFTILVLICYGMLSQGSNVKLRLSLGILLSILCYFLLFTKINELIFERFTNFDSADQSTLDLRIDSIVYNYSTMNVFEKLWGGGFGREISYFSTFSNYLSDTYSLELYLGEYIVKYGIIGTLILNVLFLSIMLKNRSFITKGFLLTLFVGIISLSISGLSGYTGQFFLGIVLGLLSNNFIWSKYKNISNVQLHETGYLIK